MWWCSLSDLLRVELADSSEVAKDSMRSVDMDMDICTGAPVASSGVDPVVCLSQATRMRECEKANVQE